MPFLIRHLKPLAGHGPSLYHLCGDNPDKSGAGVVRSDRRMPKWRGNPVTGGGVPAPGAAQPHGDHRV